MKIYTSNLVHDDTATATIQMTKAEFKFMRQWMRTPDQFASVKFPNGVYLNYRSNGWYRVDTSNTFMAIKKITTALSIIRKIAREFEVKYAHSPVPMQVPSVPVPQIKQPFNAPPASVPVPILHRQQQRRPSTLLSALFARA